MSCKRIFGVLWRSLLFLYVVFVGCVNGAEFAVTPLEGPSDIAVYEVTGNYDVELSEGMSNAVPRQEIIKEFYKSHSDEFDFIVIFSNFDFRFPPETIALYHEVKNDIRGIGGELFDNTSLYGSDGVLQGIIEMGNINSIVSDPFDPHFSFTMSTLSHELLHRWAARVTFRNDDNSISSDLLGKAGTHWSFLLDTAGSLEYGNQWVDNGNGTFTSLEGRKYFSPLDMYLMGLTEKGDVEPMLLIDNPDIDPMRVSESGVTVEGIAQYVSIDDIIAAEGERVPAFAESQKSFKIGCIYITRPGTYSEIELAGIRHTMENWPIWFSGLTGGVAKIAIENDPLQDLPVNPGPDIPAIDPRTAPPEVNEGLAWLLANQREDGSWLDDSLTTDRDTTTVLSSLAGYTPGATAFERGVTWLEGNEPQNLDYLARKIKLLAGTGYDVSGLTVKLIAMQNSDGGWGSGDKYESTPTDTALVLQALSAAGDVPDSIIGPAISYLLNNRNADNGWGAEKHSTIQASLEVITAFLPFIAQYQLDIPIQNGLNPVYEKQNSDGGFGNSPSTIYDTAAILITLKKLGIVSEVTDKALSYLLDSQRGDGSWQASAYQTALAVNAIWSFTRDPDLSVSTENIVPTPETITSLPAEITLSVAVQNSGTTDVADAKVVLYEGTTGESGKIGETSIAVPGGTTQTVIFKTTVSRVNPNHFYVVVDPDNLIKESSEQNNTALRIVNPESTYDFAVQREDISFTPASGNIYEPLVISAKVKNNGTVDAFSVPLHLTVDNGNGPITVVAEAADLPAGKSIEHSISWVPEISGTNVSLSLTVDPHQAFAETSEDNNSATLPIDIKASEKPDLSLSYSDITFNPSPGSEAGNVSLIAKVLNRGFTAATNVGVAYYDIAPGEDGNILLGSVTVPTIGPGESVDAVFDWTDIPVSGERTISVVVDPQNLIDEIIEDNNSGFTTLRILTLPDLEVSGSSISFSPEAPREGDDITISVIVQNKGEQSAENIPVNFLKNGELIGTSIIQEIGGHKQATASILLEQTDGVAGVVEIGVVVDSDATIAEQDETNNSAERNLGVQNANLWLTHNYISPNGDGIKDSTDFGYRLTAPQDVTVVLVDDDDQVVREYSGDEYNNTSSVSLNWDGLNDKGTVVDDGQYRIQVRSATDAVLAGLLVTVDTNRSSFLEFLDSPYIYTAKINNFLQDRKYRWFPDDSGLIFYLASRIDDYPEYKTGIYTISPTGKDMTRLVPEEWSEDVDPEIGYRYISSHKQINPGFAMANNGYHIAFILEKYNRKTMQVLQQQLWTVNRFGEGLTLLDTFDYSQGDSCLIKDIFPSPNGKYIAYKLFDQKTSENFFSIIGIDGSNKKTFTPDWNSDGYTELRRLTWSSDGSKLAFSDATHAKVVDLAGNQLDLLPVKGHTVFFDWYGPDRILIRDRNDLGLDIWSVNLNAPGSPILIAENASLFSNNYKDCLGGTCVPPLLENGELLVDRKWISNSPFINVTRCDINGKCLDSLLVSGDGFVSVQLSPNAEKIVGSSYDLLTVYDRETSTTDIYQYGRWGCSRDLTSMYDLPASYNVIPRDGSECLNDYAGNYLYLQGEWFNNDTLLSLTSLGDGFDDSIAFNIKNGEKTSITGLAKPHELYYANLSPGKGYLTFFERTNFVAVGSLGNLSVALWAAKSPSAIHLQGVAADLNFSHWTLEYADQSTPDDWHTITPSSENLVIDDLLATWVPPYEGVFLVRLTVTDKAGNTSWDREVVTWGKQFAVTNIYQTGHIFSPNGDGIDDTVGLNYSVHEAVHLEFYVYNQEGILVRTLKSEHALPGDHGITWDGRNEQGGIEPDGKYTIRFLDYQYFYQIDNTPPIVDLEFSSLTLKDNTIRTYLYGLALDNNFKSWSLSYGEGETPDEWYEIISGDSPLEDVDNQGIPTKKSITYYGMSTSPSIDFLVGKICRLVVRDTAGNQSIATARFNEEEFLILYRWDNKLIPLEKNDWGQFESPGIMDSLFLKPGLHNLDIIETLQQPIRTATVQYRAGMQWHDTEYIIEKPEGRSTFGFDTSQLASQDIVGVRVKFVDYNDNEYFSNTVLFSFKFSAETIGCFDVDGLTTPYINMQVSLAENLNVLKIQASKVVDGIAEWGDVEQCEEGVCSFEAPSADSFSQGYGYPVRIMGIGESGNIYISEELNEPEPCSFEEEPEEDDENNDDPYTCQTLLKNFYVNEAAPCNSIANGLVEVYLSYCQNDEPKQLPDKINYYLLENGDRRFLKQFKPAIDGWGKIRLETKSISEGMHTISVDLVYGETVVEEFRKSTLIVDRTLPTAVITNPNSTEPLCTRSVNNSQGQTQRCLDVRGYSFDNSTKKVASSIVYGKGAAPIEWFDFSYNGGTCLESQDNIDNLLASFNVKKLGQLDHSLMLRVTDSFGNTSCFITKVEEDEVLTAGTDTSLISPNLDGVKESVLISYQVSVPSSTLNVTVLRNNEVVKNLISNIEINSAAGAISWDGRDKVGGIVPDGVYEIHVKVINPCNAWEEVFEVTVDNTPPTAVIYYPKSGVSLTGMVTEVMGGVSDTHLARYQLQVKDVANDEPPVLLNEGNGFIENGLLGIWNNFELEGEWSLILSAEDRAGNRVTTSLPVILSARDGVINALTAEPRIISPNGDNKVDNTTVTYGLVNAANITITVMDRLGNPIIIDSHPNALLGSHRYQWDGRGSNGKTVADGVYKIRVQAETFNAPFILQEEEVTLVVDTISPTISLVNPSDSSYHSDQVIIQGNLHDPNLGSYSVSLFGESENVILETKSESGTIQFSQGVNLSEGVYHVQAVAEDAGANTNSTTVSFTIDKTPPSIVIESPTKEEYFGGVRSVVTIKGMIDEINLQSYNIQYGVGTDPSKWINIASGVEQPIDNILATWAIGEDITLIDGDYTLRVEAIDKAGWVSTELVLIHLDDNAPELAIAKPLAGDFVTDSLDIIGTVTDRYLKEFTLEISASSCVTAGNWSLLRVGTESIQNSLIASMDALPPDGDYCIRLSAVDFADNASQQMVDFTIDTTPPSPPVLTGILDEAGVSLAWRGNSETDLAGFNLYKNKTKVNAAPFTETQFQDVDLLQGEYRYTIRAVDAAGLESVDSNQVIFTVDFTPPEVMINSPRDGFLVNNYLDIIGRAYSNDDFKEYRVSYSVGSDSQSWELLRKSPTPVPYGTLVRWDVITLTDGPYTIKLEAEDLNGNVAEKIVNVTVDNTAPAGPILLSAEPVGSTVNLTWQANAEPDLAGYLVFRNGHPANASGTIIDDFSPYLVTGFDFANIEVPDGNHDYYLIAMDNAGNMSVQSNTLHVSIDTRAPTISIISPSEGLEFDKVIAVKAESEDTDIDTVRFQYRHVDAPAWIDFGETLTRPYVINLDPATLELQYGLYILRAVATDLGGKVEESPQEVSVHYNDITAPSLPTGVMSKVKGGIVALSWNRGNEMDLAGYNVYVGSNFQKKNNSLLTDTSFIDPPVGTLPELVDGDYQYAVTAVDSAGNESARSIAFATIFTPILDSPIGVVNMPDYSVAGTTHSGVSVDIYRNYDVNPELLGTTSSGSDGRFVFTISLNEGENNLKAVAVDPTGNTSKPSKIVSVIYDIRPEPPTGLVAEVDNFDVHLSWAANTESDLAGYNLYRSTTSEAQKINTSLLVSTNYVDINPANNTYSYYVVAVDESGNESGPSNKVSVVIERQLPAPPVNLVAISSPEGKSVELCWENSVNKVETYIVYRGLISGGPYEKVGTTPANNFCYVDSGLINGQDYFYIVRSVDYYGNESVGSNEVSATPQDTVSPSKPFFIQPTTSGKPYQSLTGAIDILGAGEPGTLIDLIHNNDWVETTEALQESIYESFTIDPTTKFHEMNVLPNGSSVIYKLNAAPPIGYYTFQKDLETGTEIRLNAIPSISWNYVLSPDGINLAYIDNSGYMIRIGIYNLSSGTTTQIPFYISRYEIPHLSWNTDGSKLLFESNSKRNDLWEYDLSTKTIFKLTGNLPGKYPELSSSGQLIAFLIQVSYYSPRQKLYLKDLKNGTYTFVDYVLYPESYKFIDWSTQAEKLAYISNRNGYDDLYVFDAQTGETTKLTDTPGVEMSPQWSPDGNFISFWVKSGSEVEMRMVSVGEKADESALISFDEGTNFYFKWLPAGFFCGVNSELYKITPPGTFIFQNVGLMPGQNIFTAIAQDGAGNVSEPADEIVVTIDGEIMPDLEVLDQDIYILPGVPLVGEDVTLGVLVGNRSGVSGGNVTVDMYIRNSVGKVELVHSETLSSLDPNSEEWLSTTLNTANLAGKNTLYVVLDSDELIAEAREDNNRGSTDFYVAEEEGVSFDLSLNGDTFWSDEVASLVIDMYNSGAAQSVRLSVMIEDEYGTLVEELAVLDKALPYGAIESMELGWHASSVFAGKYRARAVMVDAEGTFIAERIKPFTVLPDIEIDALLTTDKLEYGSNENVQLDLSVTNRGRNVMLPELTVKATITSDTTLLHSEEHTLLNLYPGDSTNLIVTWNTALNAPADYTASIEIYLEGELVEVCSSRFTIAPVTKLSGSVSVNPKVIFPSGGVEATYSVSNNGNIEAGTIHLQLLVVNPDNWSVVAQHEESIAVGMNETISGQHPFVGVPWNIGTYLVQLKAVHQDETLILADDSFLVKDGVAPLVTVESPIPGSVITDSLQLSVLATDEGSGVAKVEYQIDGGPMVPLPLLDAAVGRYAAGLAAVMIGEGPHTISFIAVDNGGNSSQPIEVNIIVELCKPFEELAGSLYISPSPLYYSQPVEVRYNLINQCAKTINGLNVRISVTDPSTGDVVYEKEDTTTIAPESTVSDEFVFSTLELHEQRYTVRLHIDLPEKEPRVVAESSFEILPALEAENKVLDQTNLLVWLNNGADNCNESCASYAHIENILNQVADYSLIVCDRADFESELGNSFYTDVMIIGDQHRLTDHHIKGLRERINSGTGLISYGWSVQGDNSQSDNGHNKPKGSFLGVTAKGSLPASSRLLTLAESQVSTAGEVEISGKLVQVETDKAAEVTGWVMDKCPSKETGKGQPVNNTQECSYPVVVTNEYGLGRTVYMSFDPCETFNELNVEQLTELFIKTVQFVHHPIDDPELIPHQVKPFAFEITSPGLDFDLRVSTTCPPEIKLYDPAGDNWIAEYPWEVTFPVQAGETAVLPYYVLAPDKEGSYDCETSTGFDQAGQYTMLQQTMSEFVVNKDRAHRLNEIKAAMRELELLGYEDSMRNKVLQYLENVLEWPVTDCEKSKLNILDIESAIDSLLNIESIDNEDLRLQLDTLLRIEQGRCYFYE